MNSPCVNYCVLTVPMGPGLINSWNLEWSQEIDLQGWALGIGSVVPFGLSTLLSSLAMGDGMLVSHGTAPSQLVKLLPVVDYDEVPIKHEP